MGRKLKIILSFPRTLWFNFRYLPFSQALKLPVWIANNVRIEKLNRTGIDLKDTNIRLGSVRIGYHEADAVDCYSVHTVISIERGGKWIINQDAHIGQGAIIRIKCNGQLIIGRNFAISGTASIICSKRITFGDDVQLSWNSLFIDSDAHKVFAEDAILINPPKEIYIGNRVWISANTTIMKGSIIRDDTVVAANTMINRYVSDGNCILAGIPAKTVKKIRNFEI
jgi:acetyltransferase-like isoleucine patch superfamily enzyme